MKFSHIKQAKFISYRVVSLSELAQLPYKQPLNNNTLWGQVNIKNIYYTIFSNVLCLCLLHPPPLPPPTRMCFNINSESAVCTLFRCLIKQCQLTSQQDYTHVVKDTVTFLSTNNFPSSCHLLNSSPCFDVL